MVAEVTGGRESSGGGSEGGVSGRGAGEEETASKWSYFGLEGSGWLGVDERMGSKCVQAVEGTGGEPKVAEQPLPLPGRWMLAQSTSNIGRCPCQRSTRQGGQRLKWAWALA